MAVPRQLMGVEVADQVELVALRGAGEVPVLEVAERGARLLVDAEQRRIEAGDLVRPDLGGLADRGQEGAAIVARAAVARRRVQRDALPSVSLTI